MAGRILLPSDVAESDEQDESDRWARTGSGLIVPADIELPPARPVAIDLFCGCGGFSLGIIEAGFNVVAALDNDPAAAVTYLHNLGAYPLNFHFATPQDEERMDKFLEEENRRSNKGKDFHVPARSGANWDPMTRSWAKAPGAAPVGHFFFGDVRRFTGKQILEAVGYERGEIDLVVGGPPCQGFSVSGRRNVADPRNNLVFEFARLALEINPKSMAMENVPGILSMVTPEGLPVMDVLTRILSDGGWGATDALRKSLVGTSGAGAIIRGRATEKKESAARRSHAERKDGKKKKKELKQLSLL